LTQGVALKKEYRSPEFEPIKYSVEDVLLESNTNPTNPTGTDGWEEHINKP